MALRASLILILLLVVTPAAAAEAYMADPYGERIDQTLIFDTKSVVFHYVDAAAASTASVSVQIARDPDIHIVYDTVPLSLYVDGHWRSTTYRYVVDSSYYDQAFEPQFWRVVVDGNAGAWHNVHISPASLRAPYIYDLEYTQVDGHVRADWLVRWAAVSGGDGGRLVVTWIPRSGESQVTSIDVRNHRGIHEYHDTSPFAGGTLGWLDIYAESESESNSRYTREFPTPSPTPTPSPSPTPTPSPSPTPTPSPSPTPTPSPSPSPSPTIPQVIPTGILDYPTPLPTIAPTPDVTPVPVGTLAYAGIPTWSSEFRLRAQPLPRAMTDQLYIDVPQWSNFTVPVWLHDPVPVVGPAAGVAESIDRIIDAGVAAIVSPIDAIINPIVVWVAKLAAGIGDAIGALGTWISGIAIYARGFGDCYWVLVPLPVWVAAAIAVWWRLLHVVLAFLGSEQYTWLFEVKH